MVQSGDGEGSKLMYGQEHERKTMESFEGQDKEGIPTCFLEDQ